MAKKRGNPNFHKGMKSNNPKGRPKGVKNTRTEMQNALIDAFAGGVQRDFERVVETIVKRAIDGDMTAAKLILDRVVPARKSVEHLGPAEGQGGINIIIGALGDDQPKRIDNNTVLVEYNEEIDDEG